MTARRPEGRKEVGSLIVEGGEGCSKTSLILFHQKERLKQQGTLNNLFQSLFCGSTGS